MILSGDDDVRDRDLAAIAEVTIAAFLDLENGSQTEHSIISAPRGRGMRSQLLVRHRWIIVAGGMRRVFCTGRGHGDRDPVATRGAGFKLGRRPCARALQSSRFP